MDEGKIVDTYRLLLSIQTAVNRLDVKWKKAHFALPSPIVMVRFLKLPNLARKEMNKLIDFEMKHHIHLPFEQPFFDYFKMNGQSEYQLTKKRSNSKNNAAEEIKEGRQQAAAQSDLLFGLTTNSENPSIADVKSGQLCDIMLVAAPRERVEEYVKIIHNANVKLTSIEIKPLSLYRAIRKLDNNNIITHQTFLLVDLGRIASDVSIFDEGQLKITRNIYINFPLGNDSKEVLDENDPLFILEITGGDNDFINACSELVHEIERLINFYRYTLNHRDHEFQRIIISGDVERIDEIRSYLEQQLVREVSFISCNQIQSKETDLKLIFPSIATAFGLALRGESD